MWSRMLTTTPNFLWRMRTALMVSVVVGGLLAESPPTFAQPDAGTKAADSKDAESKPAEAASPSQQAIRKAYRISQKARSEQDYLQMIQLLDKALTDSTATERARRDASRLKGWAHNRRGEILARQGKEKSATVQFDLAIQLNGDHWKARYNRGVSHSLAGELDNAIDELNRAIELKRDYPMTWFNRGEAFYAQGKLRESIRDYTEAIRLDPENARFYHHRGYSHYSLREYDKAITDFDSSIEFKSDDAVPYIYRGDAYAELGSYQQALQNYRRALDLNRELGRAYLSVAWLLATCPDEQFRDEDQALAAAKKAIALDGEDAGHRYLEVLAAAQANAGEFAEAQETQTQVVEQAPDTAQEDCKVRLALYNQDRPYRQQPAPVAGQWRPQSEP